MGTARTLDGSHGGTLSQASPMEPGLISRNGWVVVDDSSRPLFDAANFSSTQGEQSEWPWVMLRPPATTRTGTSSAMDTITSRRSGYA